MAEQITNGVRTTLTAAITSTGATTFSIASKTNVHGVVLSTATGNLRALIDNEVFIITDITNLVCTCTRAAEGSTAATHANGATVELGSLTAGGLATAAADRQNAVFADNAARAAAVPAYVGQLGYQSDTDVWYRATGTSAGNWVVNQIHNPLGAKFYRGQNAGIFEDGSATLTWNGVAGHFFETSKASYCTYPERLLTATLASGNFDQYTGWFSLGVFTALQSWDFLSAKNVVGIDSVPATLSYLDASTTAIQSWDEIIIALAANGLSNGTLKIPGTTNQYVTAASNAARATLIANGWTNVGWDGTAL